MDSNSCSHFPPVGKTEEIGWGPNSVWTARNYGSFSKAFYIDSDGKKLADPSSLAAPTSISPLLSAWQNYRNNGASCPREHYTRCKYASLDPCKFLSQCYKGVKGMIGRIGEKQALFQQKLQRKRKIKEKLLFSALALTISICFY